MQTGCISRVLFWGSKVVVQSNRSNAAARAADCSCGDEIFEGAMRDGRPAILPWTLQDNWDYSKTPTPVQVVANSGRRIHPQGA